MGFLLVLCSEPQGSSIRRQLLLSVVVKRHFNLEALPGVRANYHFKKPRLFPAGSTRRALCPSLCLSPSCLAMLMRARPPQEPACPSTLTELQEKGEKFLLIFINILLVFSRWLEIINFYQIQELKGEGRGHRDGLPVHWRATHQI